MTEAPLMPKATAVWLVENTSLTFDQIAEFCKLHPLEVKGIADGEVATGIKGYDPISTGQLTREEIAAAEKDSSRRLQLATSKVRVPEFKKPRGARYTPLSRRQDRPNAILWLLRNHAELKDAQIMRLVGTTKHTLESIRERSHWNSPNLQPMDPVTLGLCSQIDLDFEVNRAAKDRPKVEEDRSQTLVSAEVTTAKPSPVTQAEVFGAPRPSRSPAKRRSTSIRCSASSRNSRARADLSASAQRPKARPIPAAADMQHDDERRRAPDDEQDEPGRGDREIRGLPHRARPYRIVKGGAQQPDDGRVDAAHGGLRLGERAQLMPERQRAHQRQHARQEDRDERDEARPRRRPAARRSARRDRRRR